MPQILQDLEVPQSTPEARIHDQRPVGDQVLGYWRNVGMQLAPLIQPMGVIVVIQDHDEIEVRYAWGIDGSGLIDGSLPAEGAEEVQLLSSGPGVLSHAGVLRPIGILDFSRRREKLFPGHQNPYGLRHPFYSIPAAAGHLPPC